MRPMGTLQCRGSEQRSGHPSGEGSHRQWSRHRRRRQPVLPRRRPRTRRRRPARAAIRAPPALQLPPLHPGMRRLRLRWADCCLLLNLPGDSVTRPLQPRQATPPHPGPQPPRQLDPLQPPRLQCIYAASHDKWQCALHLLPRMAEWWSLLINTRDEARNDGSMHRAAGADVLSICPWMHSLAGAHGLHREQAAGLAWLEALQPPLCQRPPVVLAPRRRVCTHHKRPVSPDSPRKRDGEEVSSKRRLRGVAGRSLAHGHSSWTQSRGRTATAQSTPSSAGGVALVA